MLAGILLAVVLAAPTGRTPEAATATDKGLKWLAAQQAKDGFWTNNGGFYRVATTAHAGLALLMEGSTLKDGRYAENLRRAVAWFESVAQPNGMLVPADDPNETSRSMPGHPAALLFLASAYDADDDAPRRRRLGKVLAAAVRYAADGQTSRGGWGFVPARDGSDYDQTQPTAAMLHALLAAERAGLDVPRVVVTKAVRHLSDATDRDGGVVFSLADGPPRGGGQPYPTAAAAAALVGSDQRPANLGQWVTYSRRVTPAPAVPKVRGVAADSRTLSQHLALARVAVALGDGGHGALDPDAPVAHLRWPGYREQLFAYLRATQAADGSWADPYLGANSNTALALIILQLDNNYLPAFSR